MKKSPDSFGYLLVATAAALVLSRGAADTDKEGPDPEKPKPYQQFYANDSFIGTGIPCTSDEKICFRHNLVFAKEMDRCEAIAEASVMGCDLRANKEEFENISGRLFGVCQKFQDPCPGYRMTYDGRCYTSDIVHNIICGCPDVPVPHFLGGVECRCNPTSGPVSVEQPKEAGRCRIPDLRHPNKTRSTFLKSPLQSVQIENLNCSAEQKRCFAQGKVWVAEMKACLTLLEGGTCAMNQVVVLTREKWTGGSAICKNIRGGCPNGRVRMAFDGQCHSKREMEISVPGIIALNIMGEYDVLKYNEKQTYKPMLGNNTCFFTMSGSISGLPVVRYPDPPCDKPDKSQCPIYKVYETPPNQY